ncbi:MAG: hypothetical protein PHR66_14095 [Desulfuromonadaceae bacterium]|nr:hypothetical protein [Desulfuromonadaceae bacterium]
MSAEDHNWDSRCKQCGRCCFEKIEDERGNIFYTQTACRFLDVVSRRCKIFERRFEINPSCIKLTPELVQTLRWLPRDCGYRRKCVEPAKAPRKSRRR